MPHDERRINGPDPTTPYSIYVDLAAKQAKTTIKKELQSRSDSRKNNEFRKMFVKLGIISQAKGSAYIEMGDTKVICSVFDPREIPNRSGYSTHGELYCEFKYATFACNRRKGFQQDSEEKEYSLIMKRALEPAVCRHEFPNFQVDIYALVLENAGSALAGAIMAASLALANASVPMFGIITAVTLGIHDDLLLIDPTDKEESLCQTVMKKSKAVNHGVLMQSILSQHNQISEFFLVGSMDVNSIKKSIEVLNNAAEDIYPVLQLSIVKTIKKMLKKQNEEDNEEN